MNYATRSCFSKLFAGNVEFSYDLGELGRFYRQYSELMAHWRSSLPPDSFLEVRYEDVVEDINAEARRLIAYCGLPWDERCLDFHQNNRPVHMVSAAQVRQPLFRRSLGRGQKYHQRLDMRWPPIFGQLAMRGSRSYKWHNHRSIS